jgi:hypothetical protein
VTKATRNWPPGGFFYFGSQNGHEKYALYSEGYLNAILEVTKDLKEVESGPKRGQKEDNKRPSAK